MKKAFLGLGILLIFLLSPILGLNTAEAILGFNTAEATNCEGLLFKGFRYNEVGFRCAVKFPHQGKDSICFVFSDSNQSSVGFDLHILGVSLNGELECACKAKNPSFLFSPGFNSSPKFLCGASSVRRKYETDCDWEWDGQQAIAAEGNVSLFFGIFDGQGIASSFNNSCTASVETTNNLDGVEPFVYACKRDSSCLIYD